MTTLVKPGLLFQAAPLFGRDVQGAPCTNTTYVVCQDGSIQNYHEPTKSVGWTLTEDPMGWYYDGNKPLAVYFRGRTEDVPPGRSYMDRQDSPQFAEVTQQSDEGEEVSSDLAKIATIDPLLAQCAVMLGDPEQTSAMARFAEGKMSYAEMRGLCG
jgi:hypothetical protein